MEQAERRLAAILAADVVGYSRLMQEDDRATLEVALASAHRFGVDGGTARGEARRMAQVLRGWREHAAKLRLSRSEVEKMRGAFEHDDLRRALRMRAS